MMSQYLKLSQEFEPTNQRQCFLLNLEARNKRRFSLRKLSIPWFHLVGSSGFEFDKKSSLANLQAWRQGEVRRPNGNFAIWNRPAATRRHE